MGYAVKTPLRYCPMDCKYRAMNKHQKSGFRINMFCEKYRHPLYRDRELGKKAGRNVQPEWCTEAGH
jgi:hypothetical protein